MKEADFRETGWSKLVDPDSTGITTGNLTEIGGDKRIYQHLSGTNLLRPKCKNQFRLRDRRVKFNQ
jgi:hypothetical protein